MKAIGLVVNVENPQATEAGERLKDSLDGWGVTAVNVTDESPEELDALIGVGGDGTVLQAAAIAMPLGLPIAGVNLGRVGYLAEFEVGEVDALATALAEDRLEIVERMTIEVEHDGVRTIAVNDAVVEKAQSERMIEIAVKIDGHDFASYRTDGIIVATPVGSTAYSLSAGGPVVDPDVEAMVLTPVAPHSLLSRSLVLSAATTVTLRVEIDRPGRVNVDGRERSQVGPGEAVLISRSDVRARFLTLGRHPFPTAVRHQFGLEHA